MPRYDIYTHAQRPCNREDSSSACGENYPGLSVTWRSEAGLVIPIRFGRAGVEHEVRRVDDRWSGADHLYVKVETQTGDIYILRHDMNEDAWEITLFEGIGFVQGRRAMTPMTAGPGRASRSRIFLSPP